MFTWVGGEVVVAATDEGKGEVAAAAADASPWAGRCLYAR